MELVSQVQRHFIINNNVVCKVLSVINVIYGGPKFRMHPTDVRFEVYTAVSLKITAFYISLVLVSFYKLFCVIYFIFF